MYWRENWLPALDEGLCPYEAAITGKSMPAATPSTEGQGIADGFNRKRTDYMDPELLLTTALVNASAAKNVAEMAVRVEYQSILKLPKTDTVVFCLHTYMDPLTSLRKAPRAAEMMARGIRSFNYPTLRYRDINFEGPRRMLLDFLDSCVQ